ncbi:MAG: monofunctional biosynthetic peptidoglycan transglycosylase [Dongiaceae bacterium]
MRIWRRARRLLILATAGFLLLSTFFVVLYEIIPPLVTPLMLIRLAQGEGLHKDWVSYDQVSPNLFRAVIAAEDSRFCQHHGIEVGAIMDAWRKNQNGGNVHGASTITMQTAKNLYLWPGRSYLRKAIEVYFTLLMEGLWSKRRILELYVNVVEWGHGIYGAEAAAQHHFKKSAKELTRREAALLAAVLPNPRRWAAGKPSSYIKRRAQTILERMRVLPESDSLLCPVGHIEEKS